MVGGTVHGERVFVAVWISRSPLADVLVASMSAVLADAGCMVSAEPNPMYNDPV